MHFLEELKFRGLLQDHSDAVELRKLQTGDLFYVGLDPTAPSLQIGNLIPLFVSVHLAKFGLTPLILFGGATGAIGDPSGRSAERPLLSREQINDNINKQTIKTREIFERLNLQVEFVNNYDWCKELHLIDFLRDIGKHFPVNYMLAKDVVKVRLNADGISYTEFSYMLLQAYDFYHLRHTRNCKLQIGGSDQWGNITAGLELIRRKSQLDAHAFSFPLVTNSQGKKFGKSEAGALWLDSRMTSPYKLHQFFLNVPDEDVIKLIKIFTFLNSEEISLLEQVAKTKPEQREAQNRLADEVCNIVHGENATIDAKKAAKIFFGGSFAGHSKEILLEVFSEVPSKEYCKQELATLSYLDLLVDMQAVASKGEGKKLIQNGGTYLNNERMSDPNFKFDLDFFNNNDFFVIRTGKKSHYLVKIK